MKNNVKIFCRNWTLFACLLLMGAATASAQSGGLSLQLFQFPNSTFESDAASTWSATDSYTAYFANEPAAFGLSTPSLTTFSGANGVLNLNLSNISLDANGNVVSSAGPFNIFQVYGFSSTANYAARMQGVLTITTGGTYNFVTASDDGSVFFLDNTLLVNNNRIQGTTAVQASVSLTAGTHTVDIGYYQGGGGDDFGVFYRGPDTGSAIVAIPNTALGTIPEPSTIACYAGLGVLGLALVRRFRRQ